MEWLHWAHGGPSWLPAYPTLTQSGRVCLLAQPWVSHSKVPYLWLLWVIWLWCTNQLELAALGRDPHQRNPWDCAYSWLACQTWPLYVPLGQMVIFAQRSCLFGLYRVSEWLATPQPVLPPRAQPAATCSKCIPQWDHSLGAKIAMTRVFGHLATINKKQRNK